ncbi:tetratricopeptide repeat-containing sulfotransferase family protein [Kordiimonas sp. SCSIO 12610]|uniref:tetratricopeptide repeat-containing sulfotransferase family protein n=1 Tax=Kordiimonas sp. SCSIO 12610 TaxID=2829597 RepID=UPI00210B8166|nr:tetratricopeptide repeat-containing sulfotransferase family protein [Kordiimonas sp. SCSIO 12610]UTW54676.1 sulfotransferase [Kordiimonas sp. SCSIO 12610]
MDSSVKHALKNAQQSIYSGKFLAALEILKPYHDIPDSSRTEILYTTAVCYRYLKRYQEAQDTLLKLREAQPDFGRGFQEQGHLYLKTGDKKAALVAFTRACEANPALEASWRMQAGLLAEQGSEQESKLAQAQALRLQQLPKELLSVTNLIAEGRLLKAEGLCRKFLKNQPHHVEGMRLLADIGSRLGVLEDAEFLVESAREFAPDNIQVQIDYIGVLRKRQKFEKACLEAKALYERDPANPVFQSHYAIESLQAGDFDKALELFDQILTTIPDDATTLTSKGHALKTIGKQDEAIKCYQKAGTINPRMGDAFYALANLKTYTFSDAELSKMQKAEDSGQLLTNHQSQFCFALGKAFEDRQDFSKAFTYYERGNKLKRIQSRYQADQMAEELTAIANACNESLFEKHTRTGDVAPDPIFIVGLPRAGSTLLEQILASHSMVDGTLELPNILSMVHRLRGHHKVDASAGYPGVLNDMKPEDFEKLGQAYIRDTRIHRKHAPFFTDKMPNNFRHIGLIQLILPNAKIIDARREPMACCFSGFKQLFAEGQEFTYGLEEVGRYYKGYVELMRHWDHVLPNKILRVQYEDVVADLETQVRRILDYCGLPFEANCVDFHKTDRSVRTASSEQVRQPIYKSGIAQWQNFEPWLDPLKKSLGPVLKEYR